MSIFDWLKPKQVQTTAVERRDARHKFNALPINLHKAKLDRIAGRLLRLYETRSPDRAVLNSRVRHQNKLREMGVLDPPDNRLEALALVRKIAYEQRMGK